MDDLIYIPERPGGEPAAPGKPKMPGPVLAFKKPSPVTQKELMDALLRQLVLEKAAEDLVRLMDRIRVASAKGLLQSGELVYCQCRNRVVNKKFCACGWKAEAVMTETARAVTPAKVENMKKQTGTPITFRVGRLRARGVEFTAAQFQQFAKAEMAAAR